MVMEILCFLVLMIFVFLIAMYFSLYKDGIKMGMTKKGARTYALHKKWFKLHQK